MNYKESVQIMKKELSGYFTTPIAYIVITVFLVITGWFFFSTFFLYNQAELRGFFQLLPLVLSFVVPAVTMRLFSEEKHSGSFEILMTLPVSARDVVLGKLLAGAAFVAIMLAPTLFYAFSAALVGSLDPGPVIGGYLGALLLGLAFSAIGVFASSLTKNQIVAFIIGLIICLVMTLADKFLFFLPSPLLNAVEYIGADFHFRNFSRGIIDSRDILYFLSVAAIAFIGTVRLLEERR
ncbi:MAG TPA: ABC transporter permease [Spirochaetota bacterium]|nr:ABC transporter permease [Spirochaetota bacterium]